MKEVICSIGANITDKNIQEVSLGTLFLMEAAKTDEAFGVSPQTKSTH